MYWCEALTAEAVAPSPKEITVLAIEPSGSLDPVADAAMEPPTRIEPEVTLNAATGG